MRLPYLQLTQETWARARMLGALLGTSRREAFGMICDLWAWAVDLGPAGEAPSGKLESPMCLMMLAGALEWKSAPERLAEAFAAVGLLDLGPSWLRVRGLDRYGAAFERAAAERARKAKWREARDAARTSAGQAQDGAAKKQKQTQTQTQKHRKPKESGAACATLPVGKVPDGFRALQDALCGVFTAQLGRKYAWSGAKDTAALKRLMGIATAERILQCWRVAIQNSGWPSVSTVAQLSAMWNDVGRLVGAEPLPAASEGQPDTPAGRLWSEALKALEANGRSYAVDSFLRTLVPGPIRGDTLVLYARDEYERHWAVDTYGETIGEVLAHPFSIEAAPPPGAGQEAQP